MAETKADERKQTSDRKTAGWKPVSLGLIGACVAGAAGFYATYSGAVESVLDRQIARLSSPGPDFGYVPLDPLIVSLGRENSASHLRFVGTLEVASQHLGEVTMLKPRVVDALNTYLRAVDVEEFEQPSSMMKLRAQMLRRVQVVTGEGRIRDLLVLEFVLN
jgi:flagellar protein FliL